HTLGLGEIQVARELKEMVELGLLDVGAPTGSSLTTPAVIDLPNDTSGAEPPAAEPVAASVEAVAPPEVAFAETPEPTSFNDQPSFIDDGPAALGVAAGAAESPLGDSGFGTSDPDPGFAASTLESDNPFGNDDSFGSNSSFGDSGFGADPFGDNTDDSSFATAEPVAAEPGLGDPPPPPPPPPAPRADPAPAVDTDASDPAEVARQLANLSPRAARAVAAAARADTDEEREAALADMDESDEPLNRGLLMKFLSNE
ncbi:MAG: hypothetical protein GY929_19110, partial [Actinomycetia bacterium]|nr:hypothetical protein [Actinomycetes bacterium]